MNSSTSLVTQSPLMQPIPYNGQVYITSQRLHAEYKSNDGAKYAQLKDFNRLIRSIEAYQTYLNNGDIVELTWKEAKITNAEFAPVFESNAYNPLMLINATMQLALSHHLDDEISKSISVAVNTKAANQSKEDFNYIARTNKAMLSMAKLYGLTGNQALISAANATKKVTGFSPLDTLGVQLIAEVKEKTITPTEIGMQIGGLSAIKVNKILEENGYQKSFRDSHDSLQWTPTDKGKEFGDMIDTNKRHGDGSPIKQWKWHESIIDQLKGGVT